MVRNLNGPWVTQTVLGTSLLVALLSIVPLAHASPPDPLWIPGIYDAADLDDGVVVVTSLESQVSKAPAIVYSDLLLARILLVVRPMIPAANPRTSPARAPPTS